MFKTSLFRKLWKCDSLSICGVDLLRHKLTEVFWMFFCMSVTVNASYRPDMLEHLRALLTDAIGPMSFAHKLAEKETLSSWHLSATVVNWIVIDPLQSSGSSSGT